MSQPWMPFYIADYLGDTGNLSTLEHGAYLLLIMYYWRHEGLPNDEEELASIAKLNEAEWAKSRSKLKRLFKGGEWVHTRIEAELKKAEARNEKRVASGTHAAKQRWGDVAERKSRHQRLKEARQKGTHTEIEWITLASVFDACVKCGTHRTTLHGEALCKDHIVPIYQGGDDSIENLQPVCRGCNSTKSQEIIDFRSERLPNWREVYARRMQKRMLGEYEVNARARVLQPQPQSVSHSVSPPSPGAGVDWPADWLEELQGLAKGCPGADQAIALGVNPLLELRKRGFEWSVMASGVVAAAAKCDKISSVSAILTFIETSNRELAKARTIGAAANGHAQPDDKPEMLRLLDGQSVPRKNIAALVEIFKNSGTWHDDAMGPPPGAPGCVVPPDMWRHLPPEILAKGAAAR